jgi:transketolase
MEGKLPDGWRDTIPTFAPDDGPVATRSSAGKVLTALADVVPEIVGGAADLAPSTDTYLKKYSDLGRDDWSGRNLRFGVREHGMGGITNGMALHGGVLPYCATFFVFSDYMRASIRMAAIQQARSVFVFTHDSIGLGEDGPTHQPVEHLASLRAMPGLSLIRPADANESAGAWECALEHHGPTALVLTRQAIPILEDGAKLREGVHRGAYVLAEAEGGAPSVILIGTGSEVSIALEARKVLAADGVRARVVSMPSWDLFAAQDDAYRESVLPAAIRARVAVEAASPFGWERHVGDAGEVVGLDHFGASAPYKTIYQHFGITAEAVVAAAKRSIERTKGEVRSA